MDKLYHLAKMSSRFAINPDDDEEFIINDSVAVEMVPITSNWVHFISIRALRPGEGSGSDAIKSVMGLADEVNINLIGKIIPYDTKVASKEKLRSWYRKYKCKPISETDPDGLWARVANPITISEIQSLDQKSLNKIHKGLSDYDDDFINKKNLLLLGVGGFFLWMSSK